ncbi:MAG: hydrogenase nickel incorporation protein HypB [Lachnospiraceae bacterium]|nr:hydrogenase nickel incorporation protein HypB [Lachnospiraceae bacterium]
MREIKVVKQVLEWNEDVSDQIKEVTSKKKVYIVNVIGSPGAGKTTLLTSLIEKLSPDFKIGIIEGDITETIDAQKIDELGIPVVQLQTQGACHIEAKSIECILPMFDLDNLDVIFIENIGNLVCPAEFNIGENLRIALLSVPEGDDKVVKYPLLFSTADCMVINKADMLPYFEFDVDRVKNDVKDVNKNCEIFNVSSRSGDGVVELSDYLKDKIKTGLE